LFAESNGAVKIHRIALNFDQVEKFNPPPNPAKETDSRVEDYINRFGQLSWELDALDPQYIEEIIQKKVKSLINPDIWKETRQREENETHLLERLVEEWPTIKEEL
jgi:hypothetical protein